MPWYNVRYEYAINRERQGEGLMALKADNEKAARKQVMERKHSDKRPIEILSVERTDPVKTRKAPPRGAGAGR